MPTPPTSTPWVPLYPVSAGVGGGLPADTVVVAGTRIVANKLLAGDAQPAFRFMGDGKIEWGPGGATAPDVNLYRETGSVLRSDNHIVSAGQIQSFRGASGQVALVTGTGGPTGNPMILFGLAADTNLYRSAAGELKTDGTIDMAMIRTHPTGGNVGWHSNPASGANYMIYHQVQGEASPRFNMDGAGGMYWGSGAVAVDTNLYRSSAGTLKTDGALISGVWLVAQLGTNQVAVGDISPFVGGAARAGLAFGTAADTNLYRAAAGVLKTDGAIATMGYGTTLPAAPVDGQEYILVDSLTNPTYQWKFRYNGGSSSAYKWEFVGGSPAVVVGGINITSSGYTDIAVFTMPRSGDYIIHATSDANNNAGVLGHQLIVAGVTIITQPAGTMTFREFAFTFFKAGATAGQTARVLGRQDGSNGSLYQGQVTVTPVRVS